MKKRKRAQAEPGRDQSSPVPETATGGSAEQPAVVSEDAVPTQESAAAEAPQGQGVASEETPAQEASPADAEGASLAGEADAAAPAPEGGPDDDDGGWEDAPTRELDVGNMEFAATWADAHDTLPNVGLEPAGEEASAEGEAAGDGESAEGREGAEGAEGTEDGEALPTDEWRVESILESLLFAADRPLGVSDLKRLLAVKDSKIVTDALGALRDRRADSGIQLISVAGGWQLRTHPGNGAWVAKLVAGRPQRLSRAMMETLAIVAYRQPITRPEIDEIRGVDCGPVLRTLLDRNLIRIIGKKEEVGRPMLYGTTPEFLKTFSLRDLTELPTLREFHELGADEKAQVDKKMPRPAGEGDIDVAGAAGDALLRPATVDLPQADPAEDDELFEDLERASEAAARASEAASPPPDPADEGEPANAAGAGDR